MDTFGQGTNQSSLNSQKSNNFAGSVLENGQTSPKPIHTEEPLDPFASALKEDNSRIASQKTEADLYEQRKRFVEALNKTQKISEDRVLAEKTTAEELNNTREKIDNEINREAGQVINTSSSTEIAKKIVQPGTGKYHRAWLFWKQLQTQINTYYNSKTWLNGLEVKGKKSLGSNFGRRGKKVFSIMSSNELNSNSNLGG